MDRDETIIHFMRYAAGIAIKMFGNDDEARSVAFEYLAKSVDSYEPAKGATIKTHIGTRIRIALHEHRRQLHGGRQRKTDNHIRINLQNPENIDDYLNSHQVSCNGTEASVIKKDLAHKILTYISNQKYSSTRKINTPEVVSLWLQGSTHKEIAEIHSVTDSWIHQIVSGALTRARKHFTQEARV